MTNFTIQLTFSFDYTEESLNSAIELLQVIIDKGEPSSSLRAFNKIYLAIMACRDSGILPNSSCDRLRSRLMPFHNDVLKLNGVGL